MGNIFVTLSKEAVESSRDSGQQSAKPACRCRQTGFSKTCRVAPLARGAIGPDSYRDVLFFYATKK